MRTGALNQILLIIVPIHILTVALMYQLTYECANGHILMYKYTNGHNNIHTIPPYTCQISQKASMSIPSCIVRSFPIKTSCLLIIFLRENSRPHWEWTHTRYTHRRLWAGHKNTKWQICVIWNIHVDHVHVHHLHTNMEGEPTKCLKHTWKY